MTVCLNFSKNKIYVHKIIFQKEGTLCKFHINIYLESFYIYLLYQLFSVIYSEEYFHFYTWTSHWTAGSSVKPSIQGKWALDPWLWSDILLFIFATKWLLAFSYMNALISPISWCFFLFCSFLSALCYWGDTI